MYSDYYYDTPYDNVIDGALNIVLAVFGTFMVIILLLLIFRIIYNWIIFKKAKREGWESIIPIYNTIIKFQFLNIPMWMIILLFIPGINFVVPIVIAINMAKKFEKDTGFAIGLIFFPIIFYPILAFGKSEFHPEIKGIFETNDQSNFNNNSRYCTNCGTKVDGNFCSNCGKEVE